MTLNPDCVRQILLAVEKCHFGERLTLESLTEQLPDYSKDELWYTLLKLHEGEYIRLTTIRVLNCNMPVIRHINDLTYMGHEFLNSIRKDTIWNKTKTIANKAGVYSLNHLMEIAQEVAKSAIISALRLH